MNTVTSIDIREINNPCKPLPETITSSIPKQVDEFFARAFLARFRTVDALKEFIYAVDLLNEILDGVRSGYILDTIDVNHELASRCKRHASENVDKALYGQCVSKKTHSLIAEFFEYDYIKYFATFRNAVNANRRPYIKVTLDNIEYDIQYIETLVGMQEYSAIRMFRKSDDKALYIPFFSFRALR